MGQTTLQRTEESFAPADVFVAHDCVPGRLRLRAPSLKADAPLGPLVQRSLSAQRGVQEVRVNPITGSLLVWFDPAQASAVEIREWTRRALGAFDGGRGAKSGQRRTSGPSHLVNSQHQKESPVIDSVPLVSRAIPLPGALFSRRQQQAAGLSLLSNLFLVTIKILAGVASGSISVLAEGIQSTIDVVASGLILWTVRAAARPPDRSHPYGHGKFENVASLAQMVLILGTAGYLLTAAWDRWRRPLMPRVDWGLAALSVALLVDGLVSRYLLKVAQETGSQALEAEATHLRSDMFSCVGVLGGLVAVRLTGQPRLDPLCAAGMTGVIVVTALRLLRDTLRPLLDESLPPEERAGLEAVLNADERVLGYHRLRTRRAGSRRLVDVHILLDDALTFPQSHALAEEIENVIRASLPNVDVTVHAEPYEAEIHHQRVHHRSE